MLIIVRVPGKGGNFTMNNHKLPSRKKNNNDNSNDNNIGNGTL